VFTKSEWDFYIKLKEYLKEKNVILLSKVRLADFVWFKEKLYWYEFGKNFGAIAQKHIDFIITDYNWRILALIELDGYSHNYDKTKNNDIFKNELFESLKIPLIRYKSNFHYDFSNLEKIIA
jgi:hypothetical protein